jgi:3'-phosphoadenosine 5'-phosphosulfate sulfotransferase (PAPS reductase)/FAD synthetase
MGVKVMSIPRFLFWSGGADSTAMMVKGLETGLKIDRIFFSDTGMEFDEMYDYIKKVTNYIKKHFDRDIITLSPNEGKGYYKFSRGKGVIRGIEQVRGIPRQLEPCWLQRNAKIRPFEKWLKENGSPEHLRYIGYTSDELRRAKFKAMKDNNSKIIDNNHLYPLILWDMDAKDTKDFLSDRGILNPLYNHFDRTGCFMCPKVGKDSYYILWKYYPKYWQKMKSEEISLKKLKAFNFQHNKDKSIIEMEKDFENNPYKSYDKNRDDNDFCFCII